MDDGPHAFVADRLQEAIRVVAGIANERFAASVSKQLVGGDYFVPLPRRERDVEGPALGVDDGVELG